jgi:hypothetical protein
VPEIGVYAALFALAFVAATILTLQSEAMLTRLLGANYSPMWLITIGSVGNVLGSTVSWIRGRQIERPRHRRWFPINEAQLERAQRWGQRHGKWSLLLCCSAALLGAGGGRSAEAYRRDSAKTLVYLSRAGDDCQVGRYWHWPRWFSVLEQRRAPIAHQVSSPAAGRSTQSQSATSNMFRIREIYRG